MDEPQKKPKPEPQKEAGKPDAPKGSDPFFAELEAAISAEPYDKAKAIAALNRLQANIYLFAKTACAALEAAIKPPKDNPPDWTFYDQARQGTRRL